MQKIDDGLLNELWRSVRTLSFANGSLPVARFRRATMLADFVPGTAALQAMEAARTATDAFLKREHPKTTPELRAALGDINATRVKRLCHQRAYLAVSGGGADSKRPAANLSTAWKDSDPYPSRALHRQMTALDAKLPPGSDDLFTALLVNGQCSLCGVHMSATDMYTWKYVMVSLAPAIFFLLHPSSLSHHSNANHRIHRKHVLEDLEPFSCFEPECLRRPSASDAPPSSSPASVSNWLHRKTNGKVTREILFEWNAQTNCSHQTIDDWTERVVLRHSPRGHALAGSDCPFCDLHCAETYAHPLPRGALPHTRMMNRVAAAEASTDALFAHMEPHMYAIALLALQVMPPEGSDLGAPVKYEKLTVGVINKRDHDYENFLDWEGQLLKPDGQNAVWN